VDKELVIDTRRSEAVEVNIPRPTPPFWGTKILTAAEIPIEEVFWYLAYKLYLSVNGNSANHKANRSKNTTSFYRKKFIQF